MKKGDKIGQVILTSEPSTAGGGRSIWAYGQSGGKDFFVKRFLSPKFPVEGMPGSEENKMKAAIKCEIFEQLHKATMAALKDKVKGGGSLIVPTDFTRVGPNYYKIYERIDVSTLTPKQVAALERHEKILILQVIAHSLDILHKCGIVHGDIKPDNILLKKSTLGVFTAKLIDFDDSYFDGAPPELESIVGDVAYYSPELQKYVMGDKNSAKLLTTKSDIFSLGIVFWQFLTGGMPAFEGKKYSNLAAYVMSGKSCRPSFLSLDNAICELVAEMFSESPENRPSAEEVRERLKTINKHVETELREKIELVHAIESKTKETRLLTKTSGKTASTVEGTSLLNSIVEETAPTSRLLIKPKRR